MQEAIVLFITCVLFLKAASRLELPLRLAALIFSWQLLVCILYYERTLAPGAVSDAFAYYHGLAGCGRVSLGYGITKNIVCSFRESGLSYLSTFVIFNLFGCLGLILIFKSLCGSDKWGNYKLKLPYFVFLPGLAYWSCAIGKEPIAILSSGLFIHSCKDRRISYFALSGAMALMMVVRPHVALIMIGSVLIYFFLNGKGLTKSSFSFACCVPIFMFPAIDYVYGIAGGSGVDDVVKFIENRQGFFYGTGSGYNMEDAFFIQRIWMYLFAPIIPDRESLIYFVACIENLVLIIMIFYLVGNFRSFGESQKILFIYSIFGIIVMSYMCSNLGIAMRQKWMFLPALIFSLYKPASVGLERVSMVRSKAE